MLNYVQNKHTYTYIVHLYVITSIHLYLIANITNFARVCPCPFEVVSYSKNSRTYLQVPSQTGNRNQKISLLGSFGAIKVDRGANERGDN